MPKEALPLYNQLNTHMLDQRKRVLLFVVLPIILLAGIFATGRLQPAGQGPVEEKETDSSLAGILERGVLRAATNYNSTNYFIYRGEPMGFHLELLRLFAMELGVELEVYVSNDIGDQIDCLLNERSCDLLAMDLTVTRSRSELVWFAEPHSTTRQVLVQRTGRLYALNNEKKPYPVQTQLDLGGKTVHVQRSTAFIDRLHSLMEEIGDTIYIVEMEEDVEQLIEMVARGEIDYTVSDEHLARLHQHYYSTLDVSLPLSFEQKLSWAVRPGSAELLEVVNDWFVQFRQTAQYADIYNKYYNNGRSVFIAKSSLHSLGGGNVSVFDKYFREYSSIVGWDWRLIASLAYQESRFDPEAVSWAGAFGIMQLMPGTAESLNVDQESPVPDHIQAAITYLKWLDGLLSAHVEDEEERIRFVLASYNVGIGHVLDARRLAEKYGKDPNVWKENVDYFVLNKSKPKYYRDPVVQFGYARGSEPYNYVNEILERYAHYRNALEG